MSKQFFDAIRPFFGGRLSSNQVAGLNVLLEATKGLPVKHRAYILATAFHETGPASSALHMTPRREIWGPTEAQQRYEGRADLGNTVAGDGFRFLGRGYVQLTGRTNYRRASRLVGKDLLATPSLAQRPEIAAPIMVDGMVNGWFTGKKLADCESFVDMRRVVNGTDQAAKIADYAIKFEDALRAVPQPAVVLAPPLAPAPEAAPVPAPVVVAPAPAPAKVFSHADLARILRKIADEIEAA